MPSRWGAAPFVIRTGTMFDDVDGLTEEQRERAGKGYDIFANYVRKMHEAGVRLTLAPDWLQPGRVALLEMYLLHKAGIEMNDIFKIAILNASEGIGLEDCGVVEEGKRADLIIWEENPLEDPDALFQDKKVIRYGELVK